MPNPLQNSSSDGLLQRLGRFTAVMVVMGTIIGSGIFKKIAPMSLQLQSETLVMWCWLIAGIITLLGALTYAEVASRLAQTGGLYAYLRTMYGKPVAFLYGWGCFAVIQSASIASIAFVFAEACFRIFPFAWHGYEVKSIAIGAIFFLTLINYVGVAFGAWIENSFTILKILGIFIVVTLAFIFAGAQSHELMGTMIHEPLQALPPAPHGLNLLPAMFSAMVGAFWAYDGINNVGFIGGEIKDAKRNIPFALVFGVLGIIAIYLLVNFSYFHALPLGQILSIAQTPDKVFAIEMISQVINRGWAIFVAALIMVATFGSTNGSILGSARIYYAMARDSVFFPSFGVPHPRFKTPSKALLAQALWSSLLVISGSYDQLTDMLIFASFIFYGLGALGLLILRKKKIGTAEYRIPTMIPILYFLFCATLVVVTFYQRPVEGLVGIGFIVLGLPIYFWVRPTSSP